MDVPHRGYDPPEPTKRLRLNPGLVYVDTRVGSKEFAPILQKRHGLRVRLQKLPSADFAFTCGHTERNPLCDAGTVDGEDFGCVLGIERKTIGDLVGSLLKNRLGGLQIPDMLTHYDTFWLLVEGLWRPADDDAIEVWERGTWRASRYAITYTSLSSWLTRYEVLGRGRIKLWRTSTPNESAAFIASRYRWYKKEWKKHQLAVVDKIPLPEKALLWKADKWERVVASHDRIGAKRMRKVMKHFRSEIAFVNASIRELMAAGLGRKDAMEIYKDVRSDWGNR